MSAMDILLVLIPMTLVLLGIGVGIFYWALRSGQFEDLDSPGSRIIIDDREEQARNARKAAGGDPGKNGADENDNKPDGAG